MKLLRYADEPELRAIRYETLSQPTFPQYLQHNVPGNRYWGRLYDDFPDFQLALVTERISSPSCTRSRPPGTAATRTCLRAGTRRPACVRGRARA